MTDYDDNNTCFGSNRWTDWYSTSNVTNGNDFEILADHVNIFGSVTRDLESKFLTNIKIIIV